MWGSVFESDLDLIKLGQSWEIQFPFQAERLHGEVEYISNNVDPGTHACEESAHQSPLQMAESNPTCWHTRVLGDTARSQSHRIARKRSSSTLVSTFYVYVKLPGSSPQYRRVPVAVAQEKDDHVVIDSGLKSGDDVVTVGALILDQMFDINGHPDGGVADALAGREIRATLS